MTPSPYAELQQKKYRSVRSASHGADLSLVSAYNGFHAAYGCAEKVAKVLGAAALEEFSGVPLYVIPLKEMPKACEKLSEVYSVALIDQSLSPKNDISWGLVWKIGRKGGAVVKLDSVEDY